MARAKRTSARTDARRRYRQTQLTAEDGEIVDPTPAAPSANPPARPGFFSSFRTAYHPANVREDLPYLPGLLRHWSFWGPLLLMIGSAIAWAAAPGQPAVFFLFQTFVVPPALIVLFICGFFAKRASYLLGAILGVANVIVYGALLAYAAQLQLAPLTTEQVQAAFFNGLLISLPGGVLFCSLAAWYRRFLNLTNPNRGRRPTGKPKPKPAR